MAHDTQAFRARYRAAIHPHYRPWLHGGFVLGYGLLCMAFFWSRVAQVQPLEWLTLPFALLFFNWGEYTIHRRLGHHKTRLGALFYQRHTGDHHSFFADGQMHYEGARDWRVILFPAWLIVLFSLGLSLPLWWLLKPFNANVAALFAGMLIAGYLLYEFVHACEHLPEAHALARLPWIRQMRQLHRLHHRHALMREHNLNIVFPLMDWLFGSLYWEDQAQAPAATDQQDLTRMRHQVEIRGEPHAVLAYAATATRWPEWHPSSLQVFGPAGPVPAGSRFEEDIHAGGRPGHLSWEVLAYQPGLCWQAQARGDHGLWLRVGYECRAAGAERTLFIRNLDYRLEGWFWHLYNRLIASRRVERESRVSLDQLREAIEGQGQAG